MIDPDTRDRLARRAAELLAVFLEETDTAAWPTTKTSTGRGDRVWMKKNATQTIVLVEQIRRLLAPGEGVPAPTPEDDEQRMIREAEAAAARILKRSDTTTPH